MIKVMVEVGNERYGRPRRSHPLKVDIELLPSLLYFHNEVINELNRDNKIVRHILNE